MSTSTPDREPLQVKGFHAHMNIMEAIWGAILKDHEFYEPAEAATMVYGLGKIGYEPAFGFMTHEYSLLVENAKSATTTKEPEPTVPHHYLASLYGGSGGIYVSLDKTAARREAELDAGRGNIMSFRPATEDEVAWHRSMGGRIQIVEPAPNPGHYMGEDR